MGLDFLGSEDLDEMVSDGLVGAKAGGFGAYLASLFVHLPLW